MKRNAKLLHPRMKCKYSDVMPVIGFNGLVGEREKETMSCYANNL